MRQVNEPLHTLVGGPDAALRAHPEDGRQQHDHAIYGEYQQQPRLGDAVRRVSESQCCPQAERYLRQRARVQRLPDDVWEEGVRKGIRHDDKRRQQDECYQGLDGDE